MFNESDAPCKANQQRNQILLIFSINSTAIIDFKKLPDEIRNFLTRPNWRDVKWGQVQVCFCLPGPNMYWRTQTRVRGEVYYYIIFCYINNANIIYY